MGFLGHGTGKKLEKLGWKAAQMYLGMGMPGMPGGGDAAAAAGGGGNGNILSSLGGGTGGQAGGSQVGGSQTGSILGGLTGGGGGGGGVTSTIHPEGTGIGITGTPLANAYGYEDPSAISSMLGSGGQGPASQVGAGQQSLPGNLIGPGDRGWVGGQGGGSQKSTLGEIGSSLLDMGKDYVGGPDRVTGSDPTWQERLEGGFSAISPGFREHLKTKSDIESQGISTELNKAQLQEIREGNIEIGEDTLFPGLKGSAKDGALKHVQSLGFGTTDPQTGKTTFKKKNLQKLYKEFKENPDLQKRLFTEQGKVFKQDLNNLNSAEITAKRELAKKTLMTNGTDIKALTKLGVNVEDLIQNEIDNIDRGGTQFPEKQAFAEMKKKMEENIAGNDARLLEIKNKLVSPLDRQKIAASKAAEEASKAKGAKDIAEIERMKNSDTAIRNIMSPPVGGGNITPSGETVEVSLNGMITSPENPGSRTPAQIGNKIAKTQALKDDLLDKNRKLKQLNDTNALTLIQRNNAEIQMHQKTIEWLEGERGKSGKKVSGKKKMDSLIEDMSTLYAGLQDRGGLIDPTKSWWDNFSAGSAASGFGRFVTKFSPLTNQASRESLALMNQVDVLVPSMLNAIREATGMSARQMDSDRELQFYVQSAGGVTKSLATNAAAMQIMSEQFGTGKDLTPMFKSWGIDLNTISIERERLLRIGAGLSSGTREEGGEEITDDERVNRAFEGG